MLVVPIISPVAILASLALPHTSGNFAGVAWHFSKKGLAEHS
jgi:hypothetical protein